MQNALEQSEKIYDNILKNQKIALDNDFVMEKDQVI